MFSRLAGIWRHSLKHRPVLTNTVVYASFYTAAEMSQQIYQKYNSPDEPELDLASAGRIIVVGSCVYPPVLYHWYRFLDKKFVGVTAATVVKKVAAEQFIMTPILLAVFYTMIAVLERKEDFFEEFRNKYGKSLAANEMFWIPGQMINFALVPSHLRVVYVSCASFIWINVLCFIKRQKVEKKDDGNTIENSM